jgi:hypothetical protein
MIHTHRRPAIAPCTLVFAALVASVGAQSAGEEFAQAIEQAQGMAAWEAQPAVQMHMRVDFGGQTRIDGTVLYDHDNSRVRIEQRDGTLLVFDGQHAWASPASAEYQAARFHLLTWVYFLAAPFKLSDPGTHLELAGEKDLHGVACETARLTFSAGVGDTPEDWYLLYRDPETNHLDAMAYIVTYFANRAAAERQPHIVVYSDFETTDGVTLPMTWTFYAWSEDEGPHGDPIGHVSVSDLEFVTPSPGAFTRPADAREDKMPGM